MYIYIYIYVHSFYIPDMHVLFFSVGAPMWLLEPVKAASILRNPDAMLNGPVDSRHHQPARWPRRRWGPTATPRTR